MNIALWSLQGVLALAMLAAGGMKVATPKEKLQEKMRWAKSWPEWRIKLLGLAEVLGAVGLVVPVLTGILPVLTPVAAVCLAVLMAGAVKTHVDLDEPAAPPAILGVLCLLVAVARGMGH